MRKSSNWIQNRTAIFFIIVIALFGAWLPTKISVTLTPSLNKRIFWVGGRPAVDDFLKGKYVMFELPANPYLPRPSTPNTIKRVVCIGGDHLRVVGDKFYCNEELIGVGKHYSLKGEPVKIFTFNGHIPAGYIFLMGDHKDSFDSRYFGFLPMNEVIALVHPLF